MSICGWRRSRVLTSLAAGDSCRCSPLPVSQQAAASAAGACANNLHPIFNRERRNEDAIAVRLEASDKHIYSVISQHANIRPPARMATAYSRRTRSHTVTDTHTRTGNRIKLSNQAAAAGKLQNTTNFTPAFVRLGGAVQAAVSVGGILFSTIAMQG